MLIESRFLPPRLRPTVISERAHLEGFFEGLKEFAVTVITAPAGYGKTTLLAGWRKRLLMQRHRVAWLSLDEGDNEVSQFVAYILGAVQRARILGEDSADGASMLAAGNLSPDHAVGFIVNEVSRLDAQVFIMLDDVHLLQSARSRKILEELTHHAPPNLHLVLAGRRPPDFPLARLRASGALQEVDVGDIRFNVREAAELFRLQGHGDLRLSDIDRLHRITEGWVTGLYLASQSLKKSDGKTVSQIIDGLCTGAREISRYISEIIYEQLNPREREWLVSASIFERFCPELCDAVFGCDDSAAIIEHMIEDLPLFLPLEDEKGWARLHLLLRDFLLTELDKLPDERRHELHRRAAEWFSSYGDMTEAINHSIAAGNAAQAVGFIERLSRDLVATGNILLLMSWYEKLPAELFRQRFDLMLDVAWALILSIRCPEAKDWIGEMEQEVRSGRDIEPEGLMELLAVKATIAAIEDETQEAIERANQYMARSKKEDPWVVGVVANVLTYAHEVAGEYEAAMKAQLYVKPWPISQRSPFTIIYSQCLVGLIHEDRGKTRAALSHYQAALTQAEKLAGRRSVPASLPAAYLARLLYDMNRPLEARQIMAGRFDIACSMIPATPILRGGLAIVRAHLADGKMDRAIEELDYLESVARRIGFKRVVAACIGERVRLALARNDLRAAEWHLASLQTMESDGEMSLRSARSQINEIIAIARIRYQCRAGQLAEAKAGIKRFRERAKSASPVEQRIVAYLLSAQVRELSGRHERALEDLVSALKLAVSCDKIRLVLDEKENLRKTVDRLARSMGPALQPELMPAVHALCQGCQPQTPARTRATDSTPALAEPLPPVATKPPAMPIDDDQLPLQNLTEREYDVLSCLTEGMTNKEIAETLAISPETVKWNLKNIYQKLGVANRTQALYAAQRAQLL